MALTYITRPLVVLLSMCLLFLSVSVPEAEATKFLDFSVSEDTEEQIGEYVLASCAIIIGIFFCFFGYRLFRPHLFVIGFIVGGVVTYIVLNEQTDLDTVMVVLIALLVAVVSGLLCIIVFQIGVIVAGAYLGLLLAAVILSQIEVWADEDITQWIVIVTLIGAGAIGAFLALLFTKPLVIIATSLAGSYACVSGAAYFFKNNYSQVILNIVEDGTIDIDEHDKTLTLSLIAITALLFVVGCLVQFAVTARHYHHDRRHKHKGESRPLLESRAENKW
eukprot:TRINITY_DN17105_c0_g1_i1.p1 TRINITY_DN17105_c0_g1~~TRINITY_DN17105_c0_g1_i1.p1  ORF type:complete len:277 (-),score=64.85 TRINITY_DN17105_c0_g1_i1:165-995(-)